MSALARSAAQLGRCRAAALVFGPALGSTALVFGQTLDFKLDGSLEGRVAGRRLAAERGDGARFVRSVEGQGIEPGPRGPAVVIPVPDDLWRPAGTLAFRFRASRTLRFHEGRGLETVLVRCPLFRLALQEGKRHVVLNSRVEHDGSEEDKRRLRASTHGRVFWSHLKAGKWYHLAFAWDAEAGRMETYLNGTLQQEMRLSRRRLPWRPPANPSGTLEIGGAFGEGRTEARLAVDSVEIHGEFLDEMSVADTLKGRPNFPLASEGRWDFEGALDLTPYVLTSVYEADFTKPLNWVHEDGLFEGERRTRLPEGKDWVLEGPGKAWTESGRCVVQTDERKHLVLWNTRVFPEDFLLEFGISPHDSKVGLTIVFFAARTREGGLPFDLGVPKRAGVFRNYHSGALNCYHCSYWACRAADGGILRRTANLRKNHGFFLPASGIDRVGGTGPGPHRVRLLKVGGRIRLETRGRLSLVFDDDGETYGPVWRDGCIGLRQMGHSYRVSYTRFKVWRVDRQQAP